MKKPLLLIVSAIVLLLAGFEIGLYSLRGSVAYEAMTIKSLYSPMADISRSVANDLGLTADLANYIVKGNLQEFYHLVCLRAALELDTLQQMPSDYATKYGAPKAMAKASKMLKMMETEGYCKPTRVSRRVLSGI